MAFEEGCLQLRLQTRHDFEASFACVVHLRRDKHIASLFVSKAFINMHRMSLDRKLVTAASVSDSTRVLSTRTLAKVLRVAHIFCPDSVQLLHPPATKEISPQKSKGSTKRKTNGRRLKVNVTEISNWFRKPVYFALLTEAECHRQSRGIQFWSCYFLVYKMASANEALLLKSIRWDFFRAFLSVSLPAKNIGILRHRHI